MKCVISVLGKDRRGIVAKVSTCLYECDVNIDDMSQTRLDDMFSMTMMVTLNEEATTFDEVHNKLEAVGKDLGMQITLQREDVFQFMYKV